MLVADSTLWIQSRVGTAYRKDNPSVTELKPFQKVSRKDGSFDKLSNSLRRKLLDVTVDPRPRLSRELQGAEQFLSYVKEAVGELQGYLSEIKQQAEIYFGQGYSDTERTAAQSDYDQQLLDAQRLIDSAEMFGVSVLQDPGGVLFSQQVGPLSYETEFSVQFDAGDYADLSVLDLSDGEEVFTAAIDSEIAKVSRFEASLNGYVQGVNSQVEMIVNSTQFYDGNEDILTEQEASNIAELSKRWVNEDSAKFFGSSNVPPRSRVLDLFTFETERDEADTEKKKDTS